jgi:hypothetical protein
MEIHGSAPFDAREEGPPRFVVGIVNTVIARNLLGRLNSRTPDDLQRIAALWLVPLPGTDRGRHVGVLYRAMTDIRQARSMWDRLDNDSKVIVHSLAVGEAGSLTIEEIAARTGLPSERARSAAIRLFQAGLLAREGDSQELPVGVLPRLFLAREIGQVFRRVQDELDSGDLSRSALRVLLETMDDAELEESATIWGISVIPGQRRRSDLVAQIVRQVASPGRMDQIVSGRGNDSTGDLDGAVQGRRRCDAVGRGARRGGLRMAGARQQGFCALHGKDRERAGRTRTGLAGVAHL